MPYNGTGIFSRVYQWVNDAANNLDVDATRTDTDSNDIADGLSNCITRDGQSPAVADIPLGGFKLTGVGNGSAPGDAVNYGQAFTNPTFVGFTATGTVNLTGATVTVATQALGDNTTKAASTAFVQQAAFTAALPAQSLGFLRSSGAAAAFTQTHTGYAQKEVKGADIASSATINLSTATGNFVHITGAVAISAITIPVGAEFVLITDSTPTITPGAALDIPGGVAIAAAAGDRITVRGDTAGAVIVDWVRDDGSLLPPAIASAAEIKAGAVTTKALSPAAALAALGFTAYMQTADQTITGGGTLTIAHGLGRIPVMVNAFIKNITAELGYVSGEIVPVVIGGTQSTVATTGLLVTSDVTNLLVRFGGGGGGGNSLYAISKTGAPSIITNANWSLFLRAFA